MLRTYHRTLKMCGGKGTVNVVPLLFDQYEEMEVNGVQDMKDSDLDSPKSFVASNFLRS